MSINVKRINTAEKKSSGNRVKIFIPPFFEEI